jgi:hypothetical protein
MERDLIEGHKDTKVDADYVNKKLESMMAAIFDNMGENEERIKNIEVVLYQLQKEFREWLKKAE